MYLKFGINIFEIYLGITFKILILHCFRFFLKLKELMLDLKQALHFKMKHR